MQTITAIDTATAPNLCPAACPELAERGSRKSHGIGRGVSSFPIRKTVYTTFMNVSKILQKKSSEPEIENARRCLMIDGISLSKRAVAQSRRDTKSSENRKFGIYHFSQCFQDFTKKSPNPVQTPFIPARIVPVGTQQDVGGKS
jgi:hypothetical protein